MKRFFRELSVLGALAAVLVGMAIFAPAFFSPQPLLSLLTREAPTLVVACGMACVIITRQIDISVGSMFSVCSVCAGLLAARGWPLLLVLPASVAIGALLGAVNGLLVAGLRLPSIVVTLATMVTLRQGLNLVRKTKCTCSANLTAVCMLCKIDYKMLARFIHRRVLKVNREIQLESKKRIEAG